MSDDLDDMRAKLAARREQCFDRIHDGVSELLVLHSVSGDEILARVRAMIDDEGPLDRGPSVRR